MSKADLLFRQQIKDILDNGYDDNQYEVRPTWEDGAPAHSRYITHSAVTWDAKDGIPIQTVRKIAWQAGLREILALYQKHAMTKQDFHDAGVFWWDPWFNEGNDLGTSYGYQLDKVIAFPEGEFNQLDRVIYLLKNNPMDRRMITNMFNMEEMKDMALPPCAFMTIWSVRGEYLDLMLIQRSGDLLPAAGFGGINTVQYYFLWAMIAQVTGYQMGKMTHIINNLHIYDRHLIIAKDLLNSPTFPSPKISLNSNIKDFYSFSIDDFIVEEYKWDKEIKNIPIAE